jgi:hypothetical protein
MTDHLALLTREAGAVLRPSVVPLFRASQKRIPFFMGSGLLVNHGGARMILTAAHVIDPPEAERAPNGYIPGLVVTFNDAHHVEVRDPCFRSLPPAGAPRTADPLDLAAVRLSETTSAFFDAARFVSSALIDTAVPDHSTGLHALFGFPDSKQKYDYSEGVYTEVPLVFLMHPDQHALAGPPPLLGKLRLRFDTSSQVWGGANQQGPHPAGMSGGPTVRVRSSLEPISGCSNLLISGVFTDYVDPTLFVTPGNAVHGFLARSPDLESIP